MNQEAVWPGSRPGMLPDCLQELVFSSLGLIAHMNLDPDHLPSLSNPAAAALVNPDAHAQLGERKHACRFSDANATSRDWLPKR
jgi:hypothetical protein